MTRIYADFNAQLDPGGPGRPGLVCLERLGTLRDLCDARIRLREGLPLLLYTDSTEDEDIEIEAIARWIADPAAANGGIWAGEFAPAAFRDVPKYRDRDVLEWFPCGACGFNLADDIRRSGLNSSTTCPQCGVRVHSPIAPPAVGETDSILRSERPRRTK